MKESTPGAGREFVKAYFEVKSGRTVIPILTTGWAVNAEYNISPDFLVYRFGNVVKSEFCSIEIQNNCDAPLPFNMQQVYLKQAEEAKQPDGETKGKGKGKGKGGKDGKAKSRLSKKIGTELTEEEALSLERDFTDIDPDLKDIFTLVDLPNNEVVIPPFEKAIMKIQFKAPQPEIEQKEKTKAEEKRNTKEGTTKGKKKSRGESRDKKRSTAESKSTRDMPTKQTKRYAAYYHLQLGALVFIKEYYFLVTVPGTTQKKKK